MQPAAYLLDWHHQRVITARIEDILFSNRHRLPFYASETERTMIAISYGGNRPSRRYGRSFRTCEMGATAILADRVNPP